jgi:N-acetylneuraminic acid mutarotase
MQPGKQQLLFPLVHIILCYVYSKYKLEDRIMKKKIGIFSIHLSFSFMVLSLSGIGLIGMFSISQAQSSQWTQVADMPTGRLGLATAVVDGKIYVIGGYPYANGDRMATNEVYDPKTNTWATRAPLPTSRCWMPASTVNGKIYVFGGFAHYHGPGLPTVEEYDPETDTWTAKADMPTARLGPASCVVDGIIYVIGGASAVRQQLKSVEAYNPDTDTWTTKAEMPVARMMLSACAVNGKVYAIGGRYGSLKMYTFIEEYDPSTDIWTEKIEMPIEKGGFASCVLNEKIYIIGGAKIDSSGWTIYPVVEEYDPILNTLTRIEDMPTQRFGLGARTVDGEIFVIGGASTDISNGHPGVKTVEKYDPIKD